MAVIASSGLYVAYKLLFGSPTEKRGPTETASRGKAKNLPGYARLAPSNPFMRGDESMSIFSSPLLEDDMELKLKPVSVQTYLHVNPTSFDREDGVRARIMIENTSELATEGY